MTAPTAGNQSADLQLRRELIDVDTRPESESISYVGMVFFLGSWAMMFAALFFVYGGLRLRFTSWPPVGQIPLPLLLPAINTAVLVISSVTVHMGLKALRKASLEGFRRWLLLTIALGFTFFGLQLVMWTSLWGQGLQLTSGVYGSVFYLFTVFHILHILVGLGLLIWLVSPALRRSPMAPRRVPVKLASMFWHFVDVAWIVIFVTVYVI